MPVGSRKTRNQIVNEKKTLQDLCEQKINRLTTLALCSDEECKCFMNHPTNNIMKKLKHIRRIMESIQCGDLEEWTWPEIRKVFNTVTKDTKVSVLKLASSQNLAEVLTSKDLFTNIKEEQMKNVWMAFDRSPQDCMKILESIKTSDTIEKILKKLDCFDKDPIRLLSKKGVHSDIAKQLLLFTSDRDVQMRFAA